MLTLSSLSKYERINEKYLSSISGGRSIQPRRAIRYLKAILKLI